MDHGAACERDGGEFEADKACTDNHDLACLVQPLPQSISIGEGAQRQYAVELGSGHGKRTAPGSGREDEMVPREVDARGQMQALLSAIYCRHRVAVDQVDLLLGVKLGGPQPEIVDPGLTG